ncbi:hypothetical protein JHK82_011849 [Glycine max]|uniref:Expansin-like EG45 domain-containing protein n=1 Tax=Glycine max TaxID=3847 RepID=K7KMZ4_SOYBN|nr:hypothetical protein JHK86_011844 [Glycine max]KAG5153880.1 hypothetical protein JHK82_011849 [Glycine max]KAH1132888.1 hypothetical protein GYH30_011632 [Glycine max]KRH57277.1 hypothetical protein GLYMA_05G051200v4 [Glycine max]
MAATLQHCSFLLITFTWIMFIIIGKPAIVVGTFQPSQWTLSHATFYGDESASATMGGACGYGNLFINGYGKDTAALSSTLFNNGYACGTCYQIQCVQSSACYSNVLYTTVTATNLALLIGLRPLMTEAGATHLVLILRLMLGAPALLLVHPALKEKRLKYL